VELVRRVLQMATELVVQLDEALELAADLGDALLKLPRALLHREAAHRERDHLEIPQERVRRGRDDVALGAVRVEVDLGLGILADQLVIDAYWWHVEETVDDC